MYHRLFSSKVTDKTFDFLNPPMTTRATPPKPPQPQPKPDHSKVVDAIEPSGPHFKLKIYSSDQDARNEEGVTG